MEVDYLCKLRERVLGTFALMAFFSFQNVRKRKPLDGCQLQLKLRICRTGTSPKIPLR